MKRVYVASAVGSLVGRRARVEAAIEAGKQIAAAGMAPFIPHLLDPWFLDHGFDYEDCMAHCMVWLAQCEAVFRVLNHSLGADREVAWARANGLPVFTSLEDLARWSRG